MTSRCPPRALTLWFSLLAPLAVASAARANFVLVSQDFSLDRAAHRADFTLTFNQPPDFTHLSADGPPVNSFQIEFDGRALPSTDPRPYPDNLTAIIRGDEIHTAHALRIRKSTGGDGAGSGGWGPIIATVPIAITDDSVQFSASTDVLGLDSKEFGYTVYSLEDGSLTGVENVQFIPLPSAAAMFPAGMLVAGLVMWRVRHRHT